MGDDNVTKSRNRKLVRVTSSNKIQEHKCVDLSDYNCNIYFNHIWLKYHTINTPEWSNSHNLKIQDAGRRYLGFLGYVK